VQLKVFLGRFDARTQQTKFSRTTNRLTEFLPGKSCCGIEYLQIVYPGCVFDCKTANVMDDDMWLDFVADTGDGFNSSYQVARLLAQPTLTCRTSKNKKKILPRGSHVVIGGDLAYPDPCPESYEKRFFRTFEDALAPPPSFRRESISLIKPALPVSGWRNCFAKSVSTKASDSQDLLHQYNGPCAFALPGNHDWFDGLATFSRYILSRDWLGGWLMPQQRSYFALKLAQGWWMLGFDLALSSDIDIDQFKFFADVATKGIEDSDAVIMVTHEPWWVIDSDFRTPVNDLAEKNLRELMNTHLNGKVRVRIAGDLHHYTRYVPLRSRPLRGKFAKRRSRLRSATHPEESNAAQTKNEPELIVSGGGGAFLHGTHTFSRNIKVGEMQESYRRVGCFPNEKVSRRLSWLNIWHFRWRNWRLDVVWAIAYFGVVSSLIPLCGIYEDYLQFNPNHNPLLLVVWLSKIVIALFMQIMAAGRISLIFAILLFLVLVIMTDMKMKQPIRLLWGLSHGFAHIVAALCCLVFVECAIEWLIDEGIVKIHDAGKTAAVEPTALASSLYQEYMAHFSHMFINVTPLFQGNASNEFHDTVHQSVASMSAVQRLHAHAYASVLRLLYWLNGIPLLQATLSLFDLPGRIAQRHTDLCSALCVEGAACMLSHDPTRVILVKRTTMVTYAAAIFLYFVLLAIPAAGGVFGTWLALTLNIFKAQYNEGFSSLRIEHWKNFLKLHVNKKGDLEMYALGLRRVPKHWVKDPQWDGNVLAKARRGGFDKIDNKTSVPSWAWRKPSKWIPRRESRKFTPEIIDFALIPKRPSAAASCDGNLEEASENGYCASAGNNPIRARTSSI